MTAALTPPFAVAALVLCVAGAFKLRSPGGATRALGAIGVRVPAALVRALAAIELALGLVCATAPGRANAGALAGAYALFGATAVTLARRRESCGCFGEGQTPASLLQAVVSTVLAAVAVAGAIRPPHAIGWILGGSPALALVMITGTAGSVYGAVMAYTQVPRVWAAWRRP